MKSVCRRFLFRAIPLALLAGAASAQDILPPGGFVRGWEAAGRPRSFIEKDLFNHINGGAELFLEFGFVRLLVQPYAGGGKDELVLEVYEMTEPAAALGIYLMSAGRETPWPEIPARNSSEEAQIVAVKGRYFLKVEHYDSGPGLRPAMIALARNVLSRIPDVPLENPFAALAEDGRVAGSERLIRGPVGLQPYYSFGEGDILGLEGRTFAFLADYRDGDDPPFTRLVADYPSPEAADGVLRNLRAHLDPYLKIIAECPGGGFDFSDFQGKYGRVERAEARLEITFKRASLDRRPPASSFSGSTGKGRKPPSR